MPASTPAVAVKAASPTKAIIKAAVSKAASPGVGLPAIPSTPTASLHLAASLEKNQKSPAVAARDAGLRAMRLHPTTEKAAFCALQEWCQQHLSTGAGSDNNNNNNKASTQVAVTLLLLRLTRAFQKQQLQQNVQVEVVVEKLSSEVTTTAAAAAADTTTDVAASTTAAVTTSTTDVAAPIDNDKATTEKDDKQSLLLSPDVVKELLHLATDLSAAVPAYFGALLQQQREASKLTSTAATAHVKAAVAEKLVAKKGLSPAAAKAVAAATLPAVGVVAHTHTSSAGMGPVQASTQISVAVVASTLLDVLQMTSNTTKSRSQSSRSSSSLNRIHSFPRRFLHQQ
jgi:hypothetical protein